MYKNQKLFYAALMLMPIGVCVSCDSDDDDNESNNVVSGSATYVGVDLGLSVKWATCNLGSLNPEGAGNYYAWGETSPRIGSSWNYNWNTAPYYLSGNSSDNVQWSKYNASDGKSVLDANDDVVKVNSCLLQTGAMGRTLKVRALRAIIGQVLSILWILVTLMPCTSLPAATPVVSAIVMGQVYSAGVPMNVSTTLYRNTASLHRR